MGFCTQIIFRDLGNNFRPSIHVSFFLIAIVANAWTLEEIQDFEQSFLTKCHLFGSTTLQSALPIFVDISRCRDNFSRFLDSTVAELRTMVPTSRCDIAAVSCNTELLLSGSWRLCVLPAQKYRSLPCSCQVLPQQPQQVQAERCVALRQSCAQLKNFCAEILPVAREP